MSPDATTATQPTAEPTAPASDRAPASAPAASAPRSQLASFGEALQQAGAAKPAADTSKGNGQKPESDASVPPGASAAPASKPGTGTQQPSAVDPATSTSPDAGASTTTTVSKPADDDTDDAGKSPQDAQPSRRGAAKTIAELTAERDQLRAERDQLRTASTVPDSVLQSLRASRLPDDEFNALAAKKAREDLTQNYLTTDEVEKYTRALQARDMTQPAYTLARKEAADWADGQRQALMNEAAQQLAPVLRETEYLSADVVAAAQSWGDVYRHLRDASRADGLTAGRAELLPKLEEANGRISDLEAELSGLRTADVGRGRPLERGGVSGGGTSNAPDYRSASASDLFAAAFRQDERRSQRRAAPARAS